MIEPAACLGCCRFTKHVEENRARPIFLPVRTRRPRPRRSGASPRSALPSNDASIGEAYRLSRIHAEGWNAAHRIAARTFDRLDGTTHIESLNPYKSDPERTRWSIGFTSALAH
jgi:hypothetical protein